MFDFIFYFILLMFISITILAIKAKNAIFSKLLLFIVSTALVSVLVYAKFYPEKTTEFIQNLNTTESISFETSKDLTEVLQPSNTSNSFVYDKLSKEFVSIGNVEYRNSIYFNDHFTTAYVTYSLDGKYTELTGIACVTDNQGETDDGMLIIELDGIEKQSITLVNNASPTEFKIDLKNVKQLKIIKHNHTEVGLAKLKIK